ncbi:flagellar hook-basal body complex protein FliE [Heliobacterium mobile]|nr:flagellar hook-basal body complex protein FliE [Heliobacterium mobile]
MMELPVRFEQLLPYSTNTNKGKLAAGTEESNTSGQSFSAMLKDAVQGVNTAQNEADKMAAEFAAGRSTDVHTVMLATEKANIAMQFTIQVRNQAMEAYREIMRMQV